MTRVPFVTATMSGADVDQWGEALTSATPDEGGEVAAAVEGEDEDGDGDGDGDEDGEARDVAHGMPAAMSAEQHSPHATTPQLRCSSLSHEASAVLPAASRSPRVRRHRSVADARAGDA